MSQLLIKRFDLNNVSISDNTYIYRILYKLSYITLSGIPLRLYNTAITEQGDYFKVTIQNEDSIQNIKDIDSLFNQYNGYEPLLHTNSIRFKKSLTIHNIISHYKKQSYIDINIIKIKKHASRCYPIVYIL